MPSSQALALVSLALLLFCARAYAQATAADDPCHNVPKALRLKLIAVPAILVSSVLGVCLPLFATSVPALQPGRSLFSVVKAFASGVILATGYMHVLPDSFHNLSSPCLPKKPWGDFPFTAFVAMLAALFTLAVDSLMLTFYNRYKVGSGPSTAAVASHESPEQGGHWHCHGHEHAHGHAHGMMLDKPEDAEAGQMQLRRNRVVVQKLALCEDSAKTINFRLDLKTFFDNDNQSDLEEMIEWDMHAEPHFKWREIFLKLESLKFEFFNN
ncbi:Fe(2+) transport protein 1 [Triticum urartu]|uniref:Fe(2+) transport protein 1 n=1 Tax=Triticum urartu TaxID=4572 RepID=M8A414_TRIUA|nr:Fe(2+) transport protein 1 [Triticum urartu]